MSLMYKSDDPVYDAEVAYIDERPVIGHCTSCNEEIRGSSILFEADDYWDIDGDKYCEFCGGHEVKNRYFIRG